MAHRSMPVSTCRYLTSTILSTRATLGGSRIFIVRESPLYACVLDCGHTSAYRSRQRVYQPDGACVYLVLLSSTIINDHCLVLHRTRLICFLKARKVRQSSVGGVCFDSDSVSLNKKLCLVALPIITLLLVAAGKFVRAWHRSPGVVPNRRLTHSHSL